MTHDYSSMRESYIIHSKVQATGSSVWRWKGGLVCVCVCECVEFVVNGTAAGLTAAGC